MISDNLIFYGDMKDAEAIGNLVNKCSNSLELRCTKLAVVTNEESLSDVTSHKGLSAVVPFGTEGIFSDDVNKVTYSVTDSSATVSALNLQRRENCSCFELLYKPYMGRVYIPNGNDYTARQVLISAAVLVALGADVKKIVEVINNNLEK